MLFSPAPDRVLQMIYIFYKHKTLNHTRFQVDGAQMYLFMFNTQQIEFILFNRIHNLQ